jgi:hypothetical protein
VRGKGNKPVLPLTLQRQFVEWPLIVRNKTTKAHDCDTGSKLAFDARPKRGHTYAAVANQEMI